MGRSALRADSPALLASRGCRITRFVRFAHCAQTGCGKSAHEARCARPPRGCAARRPIQRPRRAPPAARPPAWRSGVRHRCLLQRGVRAGRGVRVKRRAWTQTVRGTVCAWRGTGPLARCGLQGRGAQGPWPARAARFVDTSGASCLSAVSEANEASYAPGHGPEHRRAVVAQRRPLQSRGAPRPGAPLPPPHVERASRPTVGTGPQAARPPSKAEPSSRLSPRRRRISARS
jgi:hypothetical protein